MPPVFKPCIVVPVYDHADAIATAVAGLKPHGVPAYLVDDGSHAACAQALDAVAAAEADWVTLIRLSPNQGKGAAVMAGFEAASAAGYSHALQIDADGQHDPEAIPALLDLARSHPQALITGIPIYDASVPRSRLYGRYVTHVWVWINTLSLRIRDSMLGFRVYPLAPALQVWRSQHVGRRMDFDTEIMVRMFWDGVDVISLPTRVTYPLDGVSHFDLWRDNLRISQMHARLFVGMLWRLPRLLLRRLGFAARPLESSR
ncbi:glycosyltransferase family 2 protein [Sinimarinibacterium sp. CAU 1509]|uniref:glycosyltransferase family 2 protein n=1 Tax=Sinimarinibacterium sp. CAU 1509 TaxID=2562283 RepID=UPI0010AB6403|nr:glycosyltransferase family 2 protein [Sinimarinibacterium sp. CAU 1509]TJY58292.1 glycosyltransferase family 2 protein [Sinimarinibacterium sp. CAU 1509]